MDFLSMLQGGVNPQATSQVQQAPRNPQQTLGMAPTQNPQVGRQLNMMPQPRNQLRVGQGRRGPQGATWSGIQPATSFDQTLQGNPEYEVQGSQAPIQGSPYQPQSQPQDPLAVLRSLLGL